jgi:hypothetical protein
VDGDGGAGSDLLESCRSLHLEAALGAHRVLAGQDDIGGDAGGRRVGLEAQFLIRDEAPEPDIEHRGQRGVGMSRQLDLRQHLGGDLGAG